MDATLAELIAAADRGEAGAADALFTALYRELHQMAQRELAHRGGGLTLGATTVLHEAYIDMAGRGGTAFPDRARFLGYAARVMRSVIVDYARRKRAQKRGGQVELTTLDLDVHDIAGAPDLEALSGALDQLAAVDPRLAQVVDLKFFCGLSFGEIAALRDSSERTVQRDWDKARGLLHGMLRRARSHE